MFEEGQTVWTKPWEEIEATLNTDGRDKVTGIWFVNGMKRYCNLQASVMVYEPEFNSIRLAFADIPSLSGWYWAPSWLSPVPPINDDPDSVSAIDALL